MTFPLQRKLILGAGAALLGLVFLGLLSYASMARLQQATAWVEQSLGVIGGIQKVSLDLRRALVQYRTYLLTHDPRYARTYRACVWLILSDLNEAKALVAGNPEQSANMLQVEDLVHRRLGDIGQGLGLCAKGRFREAQDLSNGMSSLQLTQRLDESVQAVLTSERSLLERRKRAEEAGTRHTLVLLVGGGLGTLLIVLLVLRALLREAAQRQRFQRSLVLNEHRLFQFLEAVPLGILIIDEDRKPFYLNRKGKELLGRPLPAEAPVSAAEFLQAYRQGTQELYPEQEMAVVRAWRGESTTLEDLEIHRPDGTVMPLQVWGTPVRDQDGAVRYAMSVFGDITERKQLDEMKYNLISIVSHQLKTPVAEINGYIENLLDGLAGPLGDRQKDYLMDMREIGMDNFRLISDLLSLSKIERGLVAVGLETCEVAPVVRMALRDYEKTIHRKGLTLSLSGVPEGLFVTADRDKLVETLRNLVSNALKFTDRGGISLSARDLGDRVELGVEDTGVGMSDAALAQLFSPQRVLGAEASRAGAGLGLYVAKNFMKAQGGDIRVESQKGRGTKFLLTLPRAAGFSPGAGGKAL